MEDTLALKMIPRVVLEESRQKAQEAMGQGRPLNWTGAAVVIAIWLLVIAVIAWAVVRAFVG